MEVFSRRKKQVLAGVDMSPKGSWDAPILEMLNWMNKQEHLVTLSSCSGRIVLFERGTDAVKGGRWLVSTHGEETTDNLWNVLQTEEHSGNVSFLVEPLLLHVECSDLDIARRLLACAVQSGYKESGLQGGSDRYIVAVRTVAMRMEIPIACDGNVFITKDQLSIFVREANERFRANATRTASFYKMLKNNGKMLRPHHPDEHGSLACIAATPCLLKTIKILTEECGWYDVTRNVGPLEGYGRRRGVPITSAAATAIEIGDFPEDGALSLLLADSNSVEYVQLSNLPKSKKAGDCVVSRVRNACEQIANDKGLDVAVLMDQLPHRWEKKGHFILIPKDRFHEEHWDQSAFKSLAEALKCKAIGRQNDIADDDFRSPCVEVLYNSVEDDCTWVTHIDNSIKYTWDITKCMFSSGNISEKIRLASFECEEEQVLDLYAGIGYWTIPLLVHCKAKHVVACEWNPASVEALDKGLRLNNVRDKCEILQGDNRRQEVIDRTLGRMNRVILGLIPTSEPSWRVACLALSREQDGVLHVHMNTDNPSRCAEEVLAKISNIKMRSSNENDSACCENDGFGEDETFGDLFHMEILHIQNVKWYAPYVRHIVIDFLCVPLRQSADAQN